MATLSKSDVYEVKGLLILILASLGDDHAVQWLQIVLYVAAATYLVLSFALSFEK